MKNTTHDTPPSEHVRKLTEDKELVQEVRDLVRDVAIHRSILRAADAMPRLRKSTWDQLKLQSLVLGKRAETAAQKFGIPTEDLNLSSFV